MSKYADSNQGDMLAGMITALANKHAQLDLLFDHTNLRLPGTGMGMELNGSMTLTVHMRELTEEENQALASKNVASISGRPMEQTH